MDQNTTGGTDKRNWRERLGIGSKEAMPKDMPRIAEDFKPAPPAVRPATPSGLRPAPMAPRVMAPRVVAKPAAPAAPPIMRPAAIAPDALANKLKSQRDAAEKLAEQRVMAARQRAEAALAPTLPVPSAAKPKFTFADDDAKQAKSALPPRTAVPQQRPASVFSPQAQPAQPKYVPQIAPPRPPLGGAAPLSQQRPPVPPQAYPQGQPYVQQQQPYVPSYVPPPAYRPIDPATGYAPQPSYNPSARSAYGAPPTGQQQPRLQVPQRSEGYTGQSSRLNSPPPMRGTVSPSYGGNEDDIFEQPAPQRSGRRATAHDYQQAYREVESGYDDEPSRSSVPWILAGLLLLVLAGFGSIWAYTNYLKPQMATTSGQSVPVVKAPEVATKVTPDATSDAPAVAPGQVGQPTKKQIYDRIVGDREVLGGQIVPTEQTPVQPSTNTQSVPEPVDPQAAPATGTGSDGTPLPLPPPPGATGDGTQGSLDPAAINNQQVSNITPAAGASPAANLPLEVPVTPSQTAPVANNATATIDPAKTVISPLAPQSVATPKPAKEQVLTADETINDSPGQDTPAVVSAAPLVKKTKIAEAKKMENDAPVQKSLGSKPVVLVPPSKKLADSNQVALVETAPLTTGTNLYGNEPTQQSSAVAQDTPVIAVEPVKKRKTLLDLFKKNDGATVAPADTGAIAEGQPELLPAPEPAQKVAAATPPPLQQPVAATGAYVAQLASFKTKAEASQEYARMRTKHGAIIGRYAPIVTQAQVAGTPRYRLSIGPMASSDVASGLCKSLFAAGERDCLVRRQ